MGIRVSFHCNGCFAHTEEFSLRSHFEGITGRPYGFGRVVTPPAQSLAPEGWVPVDPYTYVCYCPKCWASIIEEKPEPLASEVDA